MFCHAANGLPNAVKPNMRRRSIMQALYYKEAFNSARRQRVRAQKVTFSPR